MKTKNRENIVNFIYIYICIHNTINYVKLIVVGIEEWKKSDFVLLVHFIFT